MPPNNRSRDDLLSLLDHSRREEDDLSVSVPSTYDCEDVQQALLLQHTTQEDMCYSDRLKGKTDNENNEKMTSAAAASLSASACEAHRTNASSGLRKRSGSPSSSVETEEMASLISTTGSSSSDAETTNNVKTSEGLDLAQYPIFKFTVPVFLFLAFGTKFLAKNFPYVLAPWAATHTYKPAHWHYDEVDTYFDNTAWTWGTDYWLTVAMLFLAARCLTATSSGRINDPAASRSYPLRLRCASMLILYAISTLAGGYAHHHYHTVEDLNSTSFRFLWTICVGTVTSAGAAMLWIGSEICNQYHANVCSSEILIRIPTMPTWFCAAWGTYITALCVLGEISYKRPACDIFVAGTTQVVPTTYLIALLAAHRWTGGKRTNDHPTHACDQIQMKYRLLYYFGFLFNVPLLPMYPLLVQYTDLSLGAVNTLLHAWLTISWGSQGIALHHFCKALSLDKQTYQHGKA